MNMVLSDDLKARGLECARGIAEWMCQVQRPWLDSHPGAGSIPFGIDHRGMEGEVCNWSMAFSAMGLLSASRAFAEPRYERAALRLGEYLKSLQILDPFHPEQHGAIREMTPLTPWCYTRDALSAAWGFIELHRHTGEAEYLERARLWGEWFLAKGCDAEGWPLWGHQFGPWMDGGPQMRNDLQGSFQGGSLNFLYQLGKATGDGKWTGPFFANLADHFVRHIQQPSGFFCSVDRATKKPPEKDPQGGLHRANDDLGTLGLLCAHRATGKPEYLAAVNRFLDAVFAAQREDGHFEPSCACIPVVLNTLHEGAGLVRASTARPGAVEAALAALYARQNDGSIQPRQRGGINESGDRKIWLRSTAYSLIVLLKLFAGQGQYLTCR